MSVLAVVQYPRGLTSRFIADIKGKQRLHDINSYNVLITVATEVIEELVVLPGIRLPIKLQNYSCYGKNTVSQVSEDVYAITHKGRSTQTFILEITDRTEVSHARVKLLQNICFDIVYKAVKSGIEPTKISDWRRRIWDINVIHIFI